MKEGDVLRTVNDVLVKVGLDPAKADSWDQLIILAVILVLAVLLALICRYAVLGTIQKIARRTRIKWDDVLFDGKALPKLLSILPVLLIYLLLPLAFDAGSWWLGALKKLASLVMIWQLLGFLNELVKALFTIIESGKKMADKSLKGFCQIIQVTIWFIGFIVMVSVLIDKSPVTLLAGLGASAAVLMLIFKDSIVGFVSGVQLSANDMLRPGDWITMPKYGADGTVLEVTLNTVKVQNFDNTITMIPPYALTSDSFQNWRGMEESGGRRAKRSINIDMTSVKFCTPEMIEQFKKIELITEYVTDKDREMREYNAAHGISDDDPDQVNRRRQTNLGVFRRYLDFYLGALPGVNHEMSYLAKQLQPTENGIPIELTFFSVKKDAASYERLQSDVFDHILAIIPLFGLRIYQNPTGEDMRRIASSVKEK